MQRHSSPTTAQQSLLSVKMAAALVAWLLVASLGSLLVANGQTALSLTAAKQKECFNNQKVLYEGKCEDLLSTEPCEDKDKWLVLTIENDQIIPACKPCPCCQNGPNSIFFNGKCVDRTTDGLKLCKEPNTRLTSDSFGDGECSCKNGAFKFNSSAQCWPMYTQGPCQSRDVLQPPVSVLGASCKIDPCRAFNLGNTGNRYAMFGSRCYRIGEKCPGVNVTDAVLSVNKLTGVMHCTSITLAIVDIPDNCIQNLNGDCEKQVDLPNPDGDMFISALLSQAERRKKRNSGSRPWRNTVAQG